MANSVCSIRNFDQTRSDEYESSTDVVNKLYSVHRAL